MDSSVHNLARTRKEPPPQFRLSAVWSALLTVGILLIMVGFDPSGNRSPDRHPVYGYLPELEMDGGDPYIRALMRTISASESNMADPYGVLYGGDRIEDLKQHPDICIPIEVGVNQGRCSTAAGRYQFLTTTWVEKASQYHPRPRRRNGEVTYSFEPKYQDEVTYRWLKDDQRWSNDLSALLQQGEVTAVLRILSGTWTSLGFGIEDNSMTPYLVEIYEYVLAEELQRSPF